jgi:putative membrane protein
MEALPEKIRNLERPHPVLWTYYVICSVLTGPGLLFSLPYLYFRYYTLRYRFDEEGIHMKVGIIFRREVNLTYARIQDIHLRSGIIQRWLGLADVQVQTASGSSGPEMVIEGFKEFEAIRDFLYTRMRGYQSSRAFQHTAGVASPGAVGSSTAMSSTPEEIVPLLQSIRDELRQARQLLEARGAKSPAPLPRSDV